jgi:adenylate kinase
MKYLSECDIMVFDLHQGNPHDVNLAIDALKKYNFEDEKVLILISSLMVWNKTPAKMKEVDENGKFIEDKVPGEGGDETTVVADQTQVTSEQPSSADQTAEPELDADGNPIIKVKEASKVEEKPKKYLQVPYSEEDYKLRVSSDEYEEIKRIEDEILSFTKDKLKIYVLASGIMYGSGESIFESHFKKAWLQKPSSLPYLGRGKNFVPTIHVKDLARMVKKVAETKPEKSYIFAIDNTRKPTQKRLISAISNGIGTGLLESVDYPDPEHLIKHHPKKTPLHLMDSDWRIPLMLNLKIKPSSLFVGTGDEEGAGEPDFNWHCKAGLASNIQLVKDEFCKKRGLKPVKILITGPPGSGKSFYGK